MNKTVTKIIFAFLLVSSLFFEAEACTNINPQFTLTQNKTCGLPRIITLRNTTTGTDAANTNYTWKVNNVVINQKKGLNTIKYNLFTAGTFIFKLVAKDPSNCLDSTFQTLIVTTGVPKIKDGIGVYKYNPSFENCIKSSLAPDTFRISITPLTTLSTGFKVVWGDGNDTTGAALTAGSISVTHRYNTLGVFKVAIISTGGSCPDTLFAKVINERTPVAGILGPPTGTNEGCAPHTVQFVNSSTNISATTIFEWDFADGEKESFTQATNKDTLLHTYKKFVCAGTVTLTAKNACGSSNSSWNPINISEPDSASLKLSNFSNCDLTKPFNFTATSQNRFCLTPNTSYYKWDFGDGKDTGYIINTKTVNHKYAALGTYTVVLTDSNACGSDTQSFKLVIDTLPLAKIKANPINGCAPLSTNFEDISTGIITYRSWNFGDPLSGQNLSNQKKPTHLYKKGGKFTTTLSVGNACGINKATVKIDVIKQARAFSTLPKAIACLPYTFQFKNISFSAFKNAKYTWIFGDGDTSFLKVPPPHTWTKSGTYNMKFIVTDSCGADTQFRKLVIRTNPKSDFIIPNGICAGNNATFTNISTGNIVRSTWNFGEGDPDLNNSSSTVTNYFDSAKTYDVMLISTSSYSCKDTLIQKYTVNPYPIIDFEMDTTDGCAPLLINFTNKSQHLGGGNIGQMTFNWNFRNGNTSLAQNVNSTFLNHPTLDTSYTIKLIGTNSYGCSDSVEKNVLVYPNPIAKFIKDTFDGCAPFEVEFTNQSLPNNNGLISIMAFKWDFKNKHTSTKRDVASTFYASKTQDTTYNVELIAYSEHNCTDTARDLVKVYPKPLANFTTSMDSGCRPLAVTYNNMSDPYNGGNLSIMKFYWNLGNGTLDSTTNPNTTYNVKTATDTVFNIQLIAESEHGCLDTFSKNIKQYHDAFPELTVTPDKGCAPLNCVFTNTTKNATRYEWYVPNQSVITTKNLSQTFLGRPIFDSTITVRLAAFTAKGCTGDTLDTKIYIYPTPVAGYFVPQDTFCFPDAQQFFNQSLTAYKYEWDFAGTKSYLANPRHFFPKSTDPTKDTTHHIWLKATNAFGCHDTIHGNMTVLPYPKPVFSMDIDSGCAPFNVTFNNASKHVLRYEWDFGDGISSTTLNPIHEFVNLGPRDTSYQVILYTHSFDCIDSDTAYVEVYRPSTAYYRYRRIDPCDNGYFKMLNDSRNVDKYHWRFGDGTTSTLKDPLHLFPVSSYQDTSYTTWMTTSSIHNCKDSFNRIINLPQRLIIGMEDKAYSLCTPGRVNFKNNTTGGVSFFWDFGNGFGSQAENPFHIYQNAGTYNYKLTAYDKNGCPDSVSSTQTVVIYKSPEARFSFNPPRGRMPYSTINFLDGSKSAVPLTHQWFFNDAGSSPNTSSLQNPSFKFSDSGWYNVMLVVDNGGCTDTARDEVRINPFIPIPDFTVDIDSGCQPLTVHFNNLTKFAKNYTWYFGDGEHQDTFNGFHTYKFGGLYDVRLVARGPGGESYVVKEQFIKVLPAPYTLFNVAPGTGYLPDANFFLRNLTTNGVSYKWDVLNAKKDTVFTTTGFESAFKVHDTGWYDIQLISTSEFGCSDTLYRPMQVFVKPDGKITIPTAFSPNGDGINDEFKPSIVNPVKEAYVYNVFNRWGIKVFETNDINKGWNGQHKGKNCPQDLYIFTVEGRFYDDQEFEERGQFILMR